MNYLRVRNWEKFQHYKGQDKPPWIKFYRDLLNDYEFNQLSELDQGRLMRIWLLAASNGGKIPNDARWVALKIHAKTLDLDHLISMGFLEELYSNSREALEPTEQNRRTEKNSRTATNGNGHYEVPEHELEKLLSALSDKDDKTEGSLRSLSKRLRLQPADFMEALEASRSGTAKSPTAVAVSVLKKRKGA